METTSEFRTLAILAIVAAIAITVWFVAMSVGPPPALPQNNQLIQPLETS